MKCILLVISIITYATILQAQDTLTNHPMVKDSLTNDSLYNKYGWLKKDDPDYNKKASWIKPAAEVIVTNGVIWLIDRYILDESFSRIGFTSWSHNIKKGWEWDNDRLRVNFIGHPLSGTFYFNAARSNGYSYFESIPFTLGGSVLWEYFGETTRPSYNDIITTTVSGSFLGEILYRFSTKVLNDRKRGGNRLLRELTATVLNPIGEFNRIIQGKTSRVISKEVYQKEPLNITVNLGRHYVNNETRFASGTKNYLLNFQFDYGDPFEIRSRKPFDVFRMRADLTFGKNFKLPNILMGYGLLGGKNFKRGNTLLLAGGFQHYDCWNSKNLELATIGLGLGVISKVRLTKHSDFYSSFHIAGIPLAGINTLVIPEDTSKIRNYNYGGGFEAKWETTFNLSKWISISLNGYYYFIHTYNSSPASVNPNNTMAAIFKPKLSIWLTRTVGIGLEQFWYYTSGQSTSVRTHTWTEQKIFLQLFIENPKRAGSRYN